MKLFNKFVPGAAIAVLAALPVLTNGCSAVQDAQKGVCCTEFAVGADIKADIGGSAQSQVAVQAIADIGGIAASSVLDLTAACRGIAQDLGAAQADQDAAEAT